MHLILLQSKTGPRASLAVCSRPRARFPLMLPCSLVFLLCSVSFALSLSFSRLIPFVFCFPSLLSCSLCLCISHALSISLLSVCNQNPLSQWENSSLHYISLHFGLTCCSLTLHPHQDQTYMGTLTLTDMPTLLSRRALFPSLFLVLRVFLSHTHSAMHSLVRVISLFSTVSYIFIGGVVLFNVVVAVLLDEVSLFLRHFHALTVSFFLALKPILPLSLSPILSPVLFAFLALALPLSFHTHIVKETYIPSNKSCI